MGLSGQELQRPGVTRNRNWNWTPEQDAGRGRHLPVIRRAIVSLCSVKMKVHIRHRNTDTCMLTCSQLVILIRGLEMKTRPDWKQTLLSASLDIYENQSLDSDLNGGYYSVHGAVKPRSCWGWVRPSLSPAMKSQCLGFPGGELRPWVPE